jgi:Cu/Ag efflux protein CusF
MKRILPVIAVLLVLPIVAFAQKPNTKSQTTTLKATIVAIDHDARSVTLKDKDGDSQTIHAGPEVKRFDELKVGDTVTFRYTESVVVKLRKAGEPVTASSTGEPAIVRDAGARPGGTITQQQTATVLVKAVDPKVPSVTIQGEDGRVSSLKVENKELLKNVKAGDRVEINYTEALMISVE